VSDDGLWSRIKKGRLFQVLAVYLAVSWVVLQVVGELRDSLGLPEWIGPVSFILLVVGLVTVLATAWVQSHPLIGAKAGAERVPGSWQIDVAEIKRSLTRGEMPHLTWARALMGGAFAFAMLFGFAGLYIVIQDRGRSLEPEPAYAEVAPGIAVLPFSTRGADLELWREGMVDALALNLDGAGGLRTISSQTVLARWRERVPGGETPDLPTELDIARAAGGRYAVSGSVISTGSVLRMSAEIHDVANGERIGSGAAQGHPDSAFAIVNELSIEILRALLADDAEFRSTDLATTTTESIDALKAFLQAEAFHKRGDFDRAIPLYLAAVQADSTFALAYYRLENAYGWSQSLMSDDAADAAARAFRYVDRLPPRLALLVRASRALGQRNAAMVDELRAATRRYPDDPMVWYALGEAYYHMGPQIPVDLSEVEETWRRTLELNPDFVPYHEHWATLALLHEPDSSRAATRLGELRAIAGEGTNELLELADLQFHLAYGDAATLDSTLAAFADMDPRLTFLALTEGGLRDPRFAPQRIAAWERRLELGAPPGNRWFWLAPELALARGKVSEALDLQRDPGLPVATRAAFAALYRTYGLPVPDEALTPLAATPMDSAQLQDAGVLPFGIYAVDRGATEDYARLIDYSNRSAGEALAEGDSASWRRLEADRLALEGYQAWRGGDPTRALPLLERANRLGGPEAFHPVRWWLGQIYRELGRSEDAVRYLQAFWGGFVRVAPPYLELGEVQEELGHAAEARRAYESFVIAFEDADPELQPKVEEARQALARLMEASAGS